MYLAEIYRRQHRDEFAVAWWTITVLEGFDERDLIEVDRLGSPVGECPTQFERRCVADT